MQFIEDSFVSKAQIINDSQLKALIDDKQKVEVTEKFISFADLDASVFILSGKNYIDIVTKDFAKNYHNSLKIFQNDMEFFDRCSKLLNNKNNYRVYIKYNKIITEDNKHYLQGEMKPVPVLFRSTKVHESLQKSFNLIKSMTLHRLYRNNYSKHCVNKVVVDGEELKEANLNENETNINLCVILLEHKNDVNISKIKNKKIFFH